MSFHAAPLPEEVDALLLAAGKALYLANSFESKCQFVLRMMYLNGLLEEDSGLSFEDAIEQIPADKMLGGTLSGIASRLDTANRDEQLAVLHEARRARNFIAHEAADFGLIWGSAKYLAPHTEKLRGHVRSLAAGDNLMSSWVHEIEEKRRASLFEKIYPAVAEQWVFGEIPTARVHIALQLHERELLKQAAEAQADTNALEGAD